MADIQKTGVIHIYNLISNFKTSFFCNSTFFHKLDKNAWMTGRSTGNSAIENRGKNINISDSVWFGLVWFYGVQGLLNKFLDFFVWALLLIVHT